MPKSPTVTSPDLSSLASLPDDAAIDVRTLSGLLSCSERHVWRMSASGSMPAPLPVGRLKRWRLGTIREWLRQGCPAVRQTRRRP